MDSLLHGFMEHERTNSWIHRSMDSLARGLTHLRIHRFTDSQTREFTESQTYGFTSYGFTASRFHGLTDSRIHGLVGLMDSWVNGLTDSRIHGFKNGSQISRRTDTRSH